MGKTRLRCPVLFLVGWRPIDHPDIASAIVYGGLVRHSLTYALGNSATVRLFLALECDYEVTSSASVAMFAEVDPLPRSQRQPPGRNRNDKACSE